MGACDGVDLREQSIHRVVEQALLRKGWSPCGAGRTGQRSTAAADICHRSAPTIAAHNVTKSTHHRSNADTAPSDGAAALAVLQQIRATIDVALNER